MDISKLNKITRLDISIDHSQKDVFLVTEDVDYICEIAKNADGKWDIFNMPENKTSYYSEVRNIINNIDQ